MSLKRLTTLILGFLLSALAASGQVSRSMGYRLAALQPAAAVNYAGPFTEVLFFAAHAPDGTDAVTVSGNTTGANFAVANCSRAGGVFSFSDSKGNTWIAAFAPVSGAWPSNQMYYCTNFVSDTTQTFTLAGGGAFNVITFSCNGTPVFLGKTQAGTSSGTSFHPGSLTPFGTNLFIAGLGATNGSFVIDSSFDTASGIQQSEEASFNGLDLWSAIAYKFSDTAENPAFAGGVGQTTGGTASMLMFGSVAAGGGSDTAWVTSQSLGTSRANFEGTLGGKITVNSTITVTKLGRWVISGSTQTHHLGIWDNSGTLLASVTLDTTGLSAGFAYVSITPQVLTAGTYTIGSEEFSGGDSWYSDDTTISTTAVATLVNSVYSTDQAFEKPTNDFTADKIYIPLSFQYQ